MDYASNDVCFPEAFYKCSNNLFAGSEILENGLLCGGVREKWLMVTLMDVAIRAIFLPRRRMKTLQTHSVLPLTFLISVLNWGTLSLTSCSASPCVANNFLILPQYLDCSSRACRGHVYHFGSTTMRNNFPCDGPAKSKWIRCLGRAGYSRAWSRVVLGLVWVSWHLVHPLPTSSIALSIHGHQL